MNKTDYMKPVDTVAKSAGRFMTAWENLEDPHLPDDRKISWMFVLRKEIRILFPRVLRLWLRAWFTDYPWKYVNGPKKD